MISQWFRGQKHARIKNFVLMQVVHLHERDSGGVFTPRTKASLIDFPREISPRTDSRFVHSYFGRRLIHFELGVRFLDLRSVLIELGHENFYLLLLL